jgi:hypothetical protein
MQVGIVHLVFLIPSPLIWGPVNFFERKKKTFSAAFFPAHLFPVLGVKETGSGYNIDFSF